MRRGLRANVAAGYAPGGTPPTGHRVERIEAGLKRDGQPRLVAKGVVDEEKAEKVKQAFAMCAAGCSYNEIPAATDLLRTKQSYWSMFRNRSYLGILKFGAEALPGALPASPTRAEPEGQPLPAPGRPVVSPVQHLPLFPRPGLSRECRLGCWPARPPGPPDRSRTPAHRSPRSPGRPTPGRALSPAAYSGAGNTDRCRKRSPRPSSWPDRIRYRSTCRRARRKLCCPPGAPGRRWPVRPRSRRPRALAQFAPVGRRLRRCAPVRPAPRRPWSVRGPAPPQQGPG